ncbi:lipopolysaccharide kinase InaA family protein [Azomonas macrocytogenes]|uniref:tRNA A-37 threonylcarbamoyl transferase component Bud32 n=1 Tax=Azomonas macrocytogenes TaxID=69962 RepID=A0A839SZI1_AZOMA|nr:lipopolysaccharide kinase InaA family protein [Azomonas macrocytogenes]MBB3102741.1 tRNA A-37 threonylcarbamoyl transferase component Bud32 [Azomonas macrocytogenes]
MRLSELRHAGRSPELPLSIDVGAGTLLLRQWLRVLPGRRYVAAAEWQGRAVLAKLLVGAQAERHYRREYEGAQLLLGQHLPTPELLAEGYEPEEGAAWLLFDYLAGAQGLGDAWHQVQAQPILSAAQRSIIGDALQAIARLHARGLWQEDLHLDNLMRLAGKLYLIDGGGVRAETLGKPLSCERVEENLGVFFAQLPAAVEPFIEELLAQHYLHESCEQVLALDALLEETTKVRRRRLRDYLKKVGRECSLFSVRRGPMGLRAVLREALPAIEPLLQAPDKFVAAGHIYKTGGAATVARVVLDGRPLIVKRYNIKSFAHWLKRFWRPSRAWHSWREAHRLDLLGIATPRPLALLERRWYGLRKEAFLVTDYLAGQDILALFAPYLDSSPPEYLLVALDRLFAALIRERISHGDLKGHNLLWDGDTADGRWSLIDLDAMRRHTLHRSFANAYRRDRARFLRNWPADSVLHRLLDERLPRTA